MTTTTIFITVLYWVICSFIAIGATIKPNDKWYIAVFYVILSFVLGIVLVPFLIGEVLVKINKK